ncbi:MAG TPA: DUF1501 domain-containing protein [Fimbriimonas sp.]|nr:DUF1501 domain-containing protein [Fimbriimonas sp.]
MSDFLSRRDMIKHGGVIAVGLAAPRWLSTIAEADMINVAKGGKPASDTVLIVCQLSGGNDGLNTVIPYTDSLYYKMRPTLAQKDDAVLKLNESLGLHPSMKGVHELFREGKVAIIQNVGYPKPNRSHFKSMDIWQSASPDDKLKHGWIGRHVDSTLKGAEPNPIMALGLSTEKPLALVGENASIPCFASLNDVQGMLGDANSEKLLRDIQGMDAMTGSPTRVVQQANKSALDAMSVLSKKLGTFTPKQTYADDAFGKGFKQIAQLVGASPATRIVYFSAGGFDTHARQADAHAKLLENFSNAVTAFQREMEAIGKADKVIVLVFSEFGRRVSENASQGTDHGAAAPMFLIGKRVKGGLHGSNPNLSDLQDGDIKFQIDFRQVYSATLDDWMGGDSQIVMAQKFSPLGIIA